MNNISTICTHALERRAVAYAKLNFDEFHIWITRCTYYIHLRALLQILAKLIEFLIQNKISYHVEKFYKGYSAGPYHECKWR